MKAQASLSDRARSCFNRRKGKKCGCWGVSVNLRRKQGAGHKKKKKVRQKMIIVLKGQRTWLKYIAVLGASIYSTLLASESTCT